MLTLNDDVAVLAQGRALHRERRRRAGIGLIKRFVSHLLSCVGHRGPGPAEVAHLLEGVVVLLVVGHPGKSREDGRG